VKSGEESCRFHVEGICKAANGVKRRALRRSFQYADIIPVEAGLLREFFLRNTLRKTEFAQASPKELSLLLDSHEPKGLRLGAASFYTRAVLHTYCLAY
jgi:hypothetical protein